MSEFHVEVVRIGKVEKHPDADSLSITQVRGYPVVFRTGGFAEGDLAIYVPVDAVVPTDRPPFDWLATEGRTKERVKAKKLRGRFSMGCLNPALPGMVEGQDVAEQLGITKYEPPEEMTTGGDNEHDYGHMPTYTDIEGLRRWPDVIRPDEEVVVTEKVHGANARYVWADGRLWVGSRTNIKRKDEKSIWWKAAAQTGLEERLSKAPYLAVFGEVYGQVQDLKYGVQSGVRFVAFDAFDCVRREYVGYDSFTRDMTILGIPTVPVLYRGPMSGLDRGLAEGATVVGGGACVREGFVVKPTQERWDQGLGRVILKLHGEGYLLRKGG